MEIIKDSLNLKHVYVWFWVIFPFSVDRKGKLSPREWSKRMKSCREDMFPGSILPRSRGTAEFKAGVSTPGNSLESTGYSVIAGV